MASTVLQRRSVSLSTTRFSGTESLTRNRSINTLLDISFSGALILKADLLTPKPAGQRGFSLSISSPRVPTEILDRIIVLALAKPTYPEASHQKPSQTGRNSFASIASFSLASLAFHQIALRRWLEQLDLKSLSHWGNLQRVLRADSQRREWVKALSSPSAILAATSLTTFALTHLRTLSVDFDEQGLATQNFVIRRIFNSFSESSQLTVLSLTSLPRIDIGLLKRIAGTFPILINLLLSSTERLDFSCCDGCFLDSASCMIHSPIPNMFAEVSGLAHAFANALRPLTKLTNIHLGIFLSNESIDSNDTFLFDALSTNSAQSYKSATASQSMTHSRSPNSSTGTTTYSHTPSDGILEQAAPEVVSSDDRLECLSTPTVHHRELAASIILAQKLKNLKNVGWSSSVQYSEENAAKTHEEEGLGWGTGSGDWERATRVWVLRQDGLIRVRKAPW